jgi:hypothetical protein
MGDEREPVEIGQWPALAELAREVSRRRLPRLLLQQGQAVAVLAPLEPTPPASEGQADDASALPNGWLLGLVGLGESEGPTDVSENKYRYLRSSPQVEPD